MRKVRRVQNLAQPCGVRARATVATIPRRGRFGALSLIRLLRDVAATNRQEQTKLQAEVLVLRRQVQVLERQIKRVQWTPADRTILAA